MSDSLWLHGLQHAGLPFLVLHHHPELAQTHVHGVGDAIQQSHTLTPFFTCPHSFQESGSFPMSWLFTSGGQSTGASSSASVFPVNIQDWFPLGVTGLILLSNRISKLLIIFGNLNVLLTYMISILRYYFSFIFDGTVFMTLVICLTNVSDTKFQKLNKATEVSSTEKSAVKIQRHALEQLPKRSR